jgi:hypothetical protein
MFSLRSASSKVAVLAAVSGLGLLAGSAQASTILSIEAPGVQASTVAGVTTETFESFPRFDTYTSLNSVIGTYSSPGLAVYGANQHGGAGGVGNYMAIGAESGQLTATLTFNESQAYFGMWWSAADSFNHLELLSGGNVVALFTPGATLAALALDPGYFGNPNTGENMLERYVYLNFVGTGGTTFDAVRFYNTSLAGGFETDNHSIRVAPLENIPGRVVGDVSTVPEPATLVLLGTGLLIAASRLRRRA